MIYNKYLIGNSLDIKKIFEKKKFNKPNVIITSPPYFDVKNYNNDNQIGYGQGSYDQYLDDLYRVFSACYEISDEKSSLWLIVDTFRRGGNIKPLPFDINTRLSQDIKGWKLREVIIWDKGKNVPWNGKGRLKNEFEYILFFVKNEDFTFNVDELREINDLKKWWIKYPERYNSKGKGPSNIWSAPPPLRGWGECYQNHLCPFPYSLVEKIISISTNPGDLVFDPFTGSGTVLAVSKLMGRNSIGIDINREYKDLYNTKVKVGAKKYWSQRLSELNANKGYFLEFEKTNIILRKQKIASVFCEFMNKRTESRNIYLVHSTTQSSKIDIFILKSEVELPVNSFFTEYDPLLSQAKVIPRICLVEQSEFDGLITGVNIYKYRFDKFFCYSFIVNGNDLLAKQDKFDYFYSDIKVQIR